MLYNNGRFLLPCATGQTAFSCLSPLRPEHSFAATGARRIVRPITQGSVLGQPVSSYYQATAHYRQQPLPGQWPASLTRPTEARGGSWARETQSLGRRSMQFPGVNVSFERDVLPLIPIVVEAQHNLINYVAKQFPSPDGARRMLQSRLTDKLTQIANSELRKSNGLPTHLDTQARINLLSARASDFLVRVEQSQRNLVTGNHSRQTFIAPAFNERAQTASVMRTANPYSRQRFPIYPLAVAPCISPGSSHTPLVTPRYQRRSTDTQSFPPSPLLSRPAPPPTNNVQETRHATGGASANARPDHKPTIDQEMEYWLHSAPRAATATKWWQQPDISRIGVEVFASLLHRLRHHHQLFPQENLQQRVATILQAVANDPELRHKALAVAYEGSASCVDRAVYSFTQIEACHEIEQIIRDKTQPHDAAMLQKLRGIIRQEKLTQLVNKIIEQRKAEDLLRNDGRRVDAVEVHLAYLIGLKECLGLPGRTREMTFREFAGVSDRDLQSVGAKLLEDEQRELHLSGGLFTVLADHPYWKLYLEKQYQSTHDADEQISAFGEKQDQLDKHNELKVGHIYSNHKNGYIDAEMRDRALTEQEIRYTTQCNQLMEERKRQSAAWYQEKSQELITKWLAT